MSKINHTTAIPEILITTYLEMTQQAAFQPAFLPETATFTISRMQIPDVAFYLFLYQTVGEQWRWFDRLQLHVEDLEAILKKPTVAVDVLYVDGVPAGYIELDRQGSDTEIAYFGLRLAFFGRGLGKHLLSYGIAQAWEDGAHRIWLHTCNLDGPQAISNYLKRGFRVYDVVETEMPKTYIEG